MTDILDEAIYDYKEEKKLKRLKIFLKIVAILTVFGIIAIYSYTYYSNRTSKSNKLYTEILIAVSNAEYKPDDHIYKEKINLLQQSNKNIKELALLNLASAYIKSNDLEHAVENLDIVINGGYSETAKNLAMISKFGIFLDKLPKATLNSQEKKFVDIFLQNFENKSDMFYSKAMIYKALWYVNQGNLVKAKEILVSLQLLDSINYFDKANASCILNNLEVEQSK
jgi:hypothetical protein